MRVRASVYLSSSSSALIDPAPAAAGGRQQVASTHTLPTKPSSDECSNITSKLMHFIRIQAGNSFLSSSSFVLCSSLPPPTARRLQQAASLCFSLFCLVPLSLSAVVPSSLIEKQASPPPPPHSPPSSSSLSPPPHTPHSLALALSLPGRAAEQWRPRWLA